MIQLPKRSVTRFFIPLIDVLILLFCIFLLMPLVKATGEPAAETDAPANRQDKSGTRGKEQDRSEREREESRRLEQIRVEKIETLQKRLTIRVLEIDADTGKLFSQSAEERTTVASQAEALKIIARDKREADARHQELYYLILFPRRVTGFPEERQIREYENWFKDVAHGTDNPLGR